MKTACGACALLVFNISVFAQVDEPVTYAGLQAGTHNIDNWKGEVNLGSGIQVDGSVELDERFQAGLFAGREYEKTRFELEYQRGSYDLTDVRLGRVSQAINADGKYQALTLNAYRMEQLSGNFSAFLGLGIGWGKAELPKINFTNNCNCMESSSETDFVYQGRVGVEYELGENHNLFLQYTWLKLPGPVSSNAAPGVSYEDKELSVFGVGYRFRFK